MRLAERAAQITKSPLGAETLSSLDRSEADYFFAFFGAFFATFFLAGIECLLEPSPLKSKVRFSTLAWASTIFWMDTVTAPTFCGEIH